MPAERLLQELSRISAEVDAALDAFLPESEGPAASLYESMRYSIFAGGKRLRPFLVVQGALLGGLPEASVMPLACAAEMIHVSSLVHDDLPCMDDDVMRRGKPCNHKVFGEAMALLCGDALMMLGFDTAAANAAVEGIDAHLAMAALRELHKGVGFGGMLGGQALDIVTTAATATPATLDYIHRHKTGTFIEYALRAGGLISGMEKGSIDALGRYGAGIGLAFQIVDDILDVEGDPALLGKMTGSDQRLQKATYPALFGMEKAHRQAEELVADVHEALHPFGESAGCLHDLADYILNRDR